MIPDMFRRSLIGALCLLQISVATADNWEPFVGADALRDAFVDTPVIGQWPGGEATGIYRADGTGEVVYQGLAYPREWKIEGDDLFCWKVDGLWQCARFERNADKPGEFRGTNLATGEVIVFSVGDEPGRQVETAAQVSGQGGAAKPTDAELAAKLSNPTVPVMTVGNNFDYVVFDGDAPEAGDQSALRYTFQTVFPFKLGGDKGSVFFRPGIPVLFNEPVPNANGGFNSADINLGDTAFDFSYGNTTKSGLIWGGGLVGTIPTATDDALGKDQWALGPELLLGAIGKWGVVTTILSHQWDVSGGDPGVETDITTLNYIYAFPLGNGWQFFSAPVITYDHSKTEDELTLPLGVGLSKTTFIRGRPWKLQIQYWNYLEASDVFAPEHLVRISINPVLEAKWNRGR